MIEFITLIIVLGLLIFVHELGHFVVAKKSGMHVKEFGFGFPPRIFGIKKGETTYSINWIPFGGFVSIVGEDGSERENPRSFMAKSIGTRCAVLVAGVLMNVIFAYLLFSGMNMLGSLIDVDNDPNAYRAQDIAVSVGSISKNSPADNAGLTPLDKVIALSYADQKIDVDSISDVQDYVQLHVGHEIIMTIKRGNELTEVSLTQRLDPPEGEGALGISMLRTGTVKFGFFESLIKGAKDTVIIAWSMIIGIIELIKNVTVGDGTMKDALTGPVGIAVIFGQAIRVGFSQLVFMAGAVSINLAILNILPIPPLDGGKLFFTILEKIRGGKPVPQRVEVVAANVGFFFFISL